MSEDIIQNYSRFKGADWFPFVHKKDVMVLGCGGIGSWVAFLLARLGCNLYLYDMDNYDITNISGQFIDISSIGENKAEALSKLINKTCDEVNIEVFGEYTDNSEAHHIVFSCFDNMKARKIAFIKWFNFVKNNPELKNEAIFIDGRLLAEQWQIFCIRANNEEINKYYKEFLFDDNEIEEIECTFKQTSHCAAMIASNMITQFINHLYNQNSKVPFRKINFFTEFNAPLIKIEKHEYTNIKSV